MKRFNTITSVLDTSAITSRVIAGGVSITAFAVTQFRKNCFAKSICHKARKTDTIKLLANYKFSIIADIISQAMKDEHISSIEFHEVLENAEKYRKFKVVMRNKVKPKVNQITKEQFQVLLEQGREKAQEDFLPLIGNNLGIQGFNAT